MCGKGEQDGSSNVCCLCPNNAVLCTVRFVDLAGGRHVADEQVLEGVPKLLAHDAVEDEVEGAVD